MMSTEKARLEAEIEKLRANVNRLENQLSEAKENERLLVEYPDLHYAGNGLSMTGLCQHLSDSFQLPTEKGSLHC